MSLGEIIPHPIVQRIIDDSYLLKCTEDFSDDTHNILKLAAYEFFMSIIVSLKKYIKILLKDRGLIVR